MAGAVRTCLLCLAVLAQGAKVTPMEKVIGLLKDLSSKVAAEGAKEAAAYDKFACFCKEQADGKLYSIEKSDAKTADLKAQIGELDSAIAELNGAISKLSKKISTLEGDIETRTKTRKTQRDAYSVKAKDMNEAVAACAAAIDALKGSKGALSDAKVDLAQVQKVTGSLVKVVSRQPLLSTAPGAVALLTKFSDQGAPKFEYQSNDIIATLEGLLATFKKLKADLDIEEHDVKSASESTILGLANEKKFADKERTEKETVVEAKTEDREAAATNKDEESQDRTADQAFLDEVTTECQDTAQLFDQRSKTRADELSTLSKATEELQKGAVPNAGANKNLVGLQKKAVVQKATVSVSPATFVQINSVQHKNAGKEAMLKKIVDSLHGAAGRIGSTALAAVSMRILVAEDHFVKVRGLIKDLIAKLQADANSEATTKGICDTGMKKAISDRDEANAAIETANAKITQETAKKNELIKTIATLQKNIAELQKGIKERTELRNEEKADNDKTIEMSQEAVDSVKLALELLSTFYKGAQFAQTGKYVPPNSDRSGNTVGDLAPEVFDSEYKGSQTESKGIVGILEVILSDFERTNSGTKKDDGTSQDEFEAFEKTEKATVAEKQKKIGTSETELTSAKAEILAQEEDLADAKELFDSSAKKLEDLEAMCVKGEETWEERKKKREEEIEALKDALAIFEDWQKSD